MMITITRNQTRIHSNDHWQKLYSKYFPKELQNTYRRNCDICYQHYLELKESVNDQKQLWKIFHNKYGLYPGNIEISPVGYKQHILKYHPEFVEFCLHTTCVCADCGEVVK